MPDRCRTPRSWRATSRRRFRVGSENDDLARVSQHVSLTEGRVDLYRTLRELLIKADSEPSSVHRFAARLPGRLRDLERERYQLVITTNYDTALERAFDAVHEPYDLAVFVATGEHRAGSSMSRGGTPKAVVPGRSRCRTSMWISPSTTMAASNGQ